MSNVDDYYKELAARPKPNYDRLPNLQTKQSVQNLPPAEGSEGYIGAETGPAIGLDVVEGKKGYSEDRPIWNEISTGDNADMAAPATKFGGQDSTDEFADYKRPQTDEGLPQTYRDSVGAGDAGPAMSDEMSEPTGPRPETQSVPSSDAGDHEIDMPQTEHTHAYGGGAPLFKHKG